MDTEVPEGDPYRGGSFCVRDLVRRIAAEYELRIISGKVARERACSFTCSCRIGQRRPTQKVSHVVQWLNGTSSRVLLQEFPRLWRCFWGRHLWARGHLAVGSGTITDEVVREYIDNQEGEQIADESRFPIDDT